MSHYPAYYCKQHGAVVGYVPFAYREPPGYEYKYGPFCPLCISEWYARTFETLAPIDEAATTST